MPFVYILRCADRTLYTGVTNDTDKRVADHNAGRGARYTRARLPVRCSFHRSSPTWLTCATWRRRSRWRAT